MVSPLNTSNNRASLNTTNQGVGAVLESKEKQVKKEPRDLNTSKHAARIFVATIYELSNQFNFDKEYAYGFWKACKESFTSIADHVKLPEDISKFEPPHRQDLLEDFTSAIQQDTLSDQVERFWDNFIRIKSKKGFDSYRVNLLRSIAEEPDLIVKRENMNRLNSNEDLLNFANPHLARRKAKEPKVKGWRRVVHVLGHITMHAGVFTLIGDAIACFFNPDCKPKTLLNGSVAGIGLLASEISNPKEGIFVSLFDKVKKVFDMDRW